VDATPGRSLSPELFVRDEILAARTIQAAAEQTKMNPTTMMCFSNERTSMPMLAYLQSTLQYKV
jgi:hypothetical protein